jgi:hypothetical protein
MVAEDMEAGSHGREDLVHDRLARIVAAAAGTGPVGPWRLVREEEVYIAQGEARLHFGAYEVAALIVTGADRLWRLLLFLVFWSAAAGFFQWRDKT